VSPTAAVLHGVLTALAWAVLAFVMYFGSSGPLVGVESPMQLYPFGFQAAQLQFVLGRPLVGAAASYLLWKILAGHSPQLQAVLAAPLWRPFARLSYSAYLMQVLGFALSFWLLAPFGSAGSPVAQVASAFSQTSKVLLLYAWVVLYILFAFAVAVPSYACIEHPGTALGRKLALTAVRRSAEGHGELAKPLV